MLAQPQLVESHVEDEREHKTGEQERTPGIRVMPEKHGASLTHYDEGDEADQEVSTWVLGFVHIGAA